MTIDALPAVASAEPPYTFRIAQIEIDQDHQFHHIGDHRLLKKSDGERGEAEGMEVQDEHQVIDVVTAAPVVEDREREGEAGYEQEERVGQFVMKRF